MNDIAIYEGDSSKIDLTLYYSQLWSVAAKRGTPVLQADVTTLYLYAKEFVSDTTAWLQLSTASASQIAWLSPTTGQVRIYFPATTSGHAGDNQVYEIRAKMADGSYNTIISGNLHVLASVVGQA